MARTREQQREARRSLLQQVEQDLSSDDDVALMQQIMFLLLWSQDTHDAICGMVRTLHTYAMAVDRSIPLVSELEAE